MAWHSLRVNIGILYTEKTPKKHLETRPDPHHWSLQMIIILIWGAPGGGGNETDSHSHRGRSPTRTTWGIFQNQEGAIKDLPKTQRLYPNSKKFLDNFCESWYDCRIKKYNYILKVTHEITLFTTFLLFSRSSGSRR